MGQAVAIAGGFPFYGPGQEASETILQEKGDKTIVASVRAHGTGRNLQMYNRNLFVQPPVDWEQNLGRTHRTGQQADEVTAWVYRHTEELVEAFEASMNRARYVQETTGARQRLLFAARTF